MTDLFKELGDIIRPEPTFELKRKLTPYEVKLQEAMTWWDNLKQEERECYSNNVFGVPAVYVRNWQIYAIWTFERKVELP